MDNFFKKLRSLQPEIDYQALMAEMKTFSHPRRKLKELQNKNVLIRLKKGFYIFSTEFFGKIYSTEIVANLLYGPSYISLESALSYYELIPERVEVTTSVTSQKNKKFSTQIGVFSYVHISEKLYHLGVTRQQSNDGRYFLIATPEKALLDYFILNFSNSDKPNKDDVIKAVNEDLRIEESILRKIISRERIIGLKESYKNRRWCSLLLDYMEEII